MSCGYFSWLAEQEVRGSIPCLATWISEIGYLLLPSHDMTEIPLKRRKSSIQPANQLVVIYLHKQKYCLAFLIVFIHVWRRELNLPVRKIGIDVDNHR